MNRAGGTLFAKLSALPCVVIAAVEGAVIGGGFGMAAVADITIATQGSVFSMSETSLGLLPAQIAPFVAERIGLHHTRRLTLTATRVDAEEAHRIGLVDRVVGSGNELTTVDAAVAEVLRCAPFANAAAKDLLARIPMMPRAELLDAAAEDFADLMTGAEAHAGLRAFADRTSAPWSSHI